MLVSGTEPTLLTNSTSLGRFLPMVLSIKNAKADQLARELAELTGESITTTVVNALHAHLELERRRRRTRGLGDIVERFNKLPVLDPRNPDDIVGYDRHGLPS